MNAPRLWIVVPVFNRVERIFRLVGQMLSQSFPHFRLIVVDHGTVPTDCSSFDDDRITVLRENSELWWTGAANAGIKYALGEGRSGDDFILIINDDVNIDAVYLQALVDAATEYPQSIIGSVCLDEATGRVLSAGFSLKTLRARFIPNYHRCTLDDIPCATVTSDILVGRGMLVPIAVFQKIGLLQEGILPHYGGDDEFSYRAKRAGYGLVVGKRCVVRTPAETALAVDGGRWSRLRAHLFGRKSKGSLPTLLALSLCCFPPPYALYYFAVNALRKVLSTAKRCWQ